MEPATLISRLSPADSNSRRATAIPNPRSPEIVNVSPCSLATRSRSPTRAKLPEGSSILARDFAESISLASASRSGRRARGIFSAGRADLLRSFQPADRITLRPRAPPDLDLRAIPSVEHHAVRVVLRVFGADRLRDPGDVHPRSLGCRDVSDDGQELRLD